MTRILIADDQALVRGGFTLILNAAPDFEVVGEAADGRGAVDACRRLRPDVVLMDIRMPVMDGITATRELLGNGWAGKVLILTTFDLDAYVYEAVRAGASGFLLKDVSPDDLVRGVRTVMAGEALLAASVLRRMLDEFAARPLPSAEPSPVLGQLTDRERDVLVRLARGRSNAEIAAELYLSPATVKTHVARVLAKLGVRDRVQAVIAAYEFGLVHPGS